MRRNHIALALAVLIVLPGIFIKTTAQNNGLHRPFAVQPLPTATRTLTHTVSTADQLMFGGVATTILVDDPTTVTDHTPERTCKRLRAYVYFHAGGDRETYTYGKAEWSATVRGSLIGIDADDVEHEIETGIAIDIDQAHPEAVFVLPESHQYLQPTNHPLHPAAGVDKYKKIMFRINGDLADDAQDGFTCTPVGIDPYLRLSLRIDEEIVYEELASIPTNERLLSNVLYASPIEQNPGNCDPVFVGDRRMLQVVGSEVTLTWNLPYTITDARYNTYEVELIRLYNIERSKATNRHFITAKIDWTTAERFVVKGIELQLRFSPVHGSGYYAFRVRPITTLDDGSYNNPTNYGPWSSAPNDGATIELAPCNNEWSQITDGDGIFELQRHVACFFFEDIDETKVWAASRTIASDQGRSSLIGENKAYLDAFGRVVQMLDRDRSSDVTVGSQVVYDLDGRPSLQTLATPLLDDQGMRIDQLRYRPEAITHNSALYTVDAYDRLSGTNLTYHAPNTVDDASAIGQYYSDDNPDLFIAGSGGYPYTRTLYTSDGRPRSMILAGADRRPGASASQDGRSTRTLVGNVGPHELVPFFGIEAPLGSELKKVITISPDNVSSVQYLNKRGQVILSAIVQQISGENERINYDGEDALANLNGKLPNDAASLDDPNREKIFTLWGQNLEATGGTAVSEDTLKSSIRFTMSSAGSRTMNFLRDAMSGVYLSSECFTLCIPCNRSILGRIIRVDVVPSQQIWPSSGYAQVINFPFENCSTGTASTASNISTTHLEPGEYILERIVVAKGLNASGETPEQTAQAMILPDAQVASALQKVFNDAFGVGHQLLTPKQQLEQYSVNRANPSLNPLYTLPARIGTSGPCFNVPLPERKLCDVCPPGGDPAVGVRYAEYAIATYTSIVGSAPGDLNDVIFYLDQNGAKQDKLGSDADPAVPPTAEQQIARLNDMIQAMLESECQIYEEKCRYFWSVWSSLLKARCEAIRENPASPELQPLQTDIVEAFLDIVGRCYPATCTTAACKDDIIATKLTIDEGEEVAAYARIRTVASTQQIDDCIERHTDPNTSTVDWQGVSICLSSNINDVDRRKLEASSGTKLPEDVNDLLGTGKLRDQALGDLQHRCRKNCEGLTPEILRQLRHEDPSASDAKLWCRLQSVIDDCIDHCDVTEESSPAEITRFKQQLFGGVLVRQSLESPPGPCPTGFTTVSTQQNLVDALVAYLNHHYDKLRDTATQNFCVNYAAVIYNYLLLNNFQAHIPACIAQAAALTGPPVNGLFQENVVNGECDAFEASGQKRMMLRVLPGVEGRFYRPVGNDSCVWCAIDFEGPTFSTQVVHPWITTLNSMLNSLWGYELDARTPSASTEHLFEAGQTPERWYEHAVPDFLTPNQDFETALLTWVATLNNTSAFVNGSPVNWPAFASGYLGNIVIAPLPVVPVSGLFSFGTQAWRASENGTMSQVPWRAYGSFAIQFGIPSWVRRSIKNSTLGYLSWRLVPSVLSSDTPAEIGEIALNGSVAGQDYVRKYTATEPGDEYRDLAATPFTTKIGLFEQDPQRRLLFRDLLRGTTVTFDQVRFYAIQTRRLLGPLNGPADSCIITGLCSLSVSCPVCVKWDTISTNIYDQIDVVKPTPCDQRELERIKAEITRLFYERVNAIQQDINTQIREKCSAKNISAKYGIYLGEKLHHVTLYYYDRAGRLIRTVSPKGVDGDNLSTEDPSHTFVSRFHTDSRGRLLTKTVPDGGTERYYYDKYGRLRFIIDAVQWADDPQRMTYLKYDNLDRVVETGEVVCATDIMTAINTNANDMSWPGTSTTRRDVARYHYDAKANTSTESGWTAVTTEHPGFTQRNTRLRLSWTDAVADWPANITDNNDLDNVVRTFYSYDPHGSATTVINDIPVTSDPETDRLITRTDYTYDLSTGNVTAVDFQKDKPSDRFQHRYTYDAAGRMKIVETSRNGVLWDRDVVYDYNLDGSLRRETIGEDSVQGKDYTYTLLGQLKGINHPTLDPDKDPGGDGAATGPHANVGKDAFGMSFHYHEDDFLRSHNNTASPFNDGEPSMLGVPQPNNAAPYNLYSGYIGGWAYRTQATDDASVLRDGMLLGERFRYDKIGRLRSDTTYSFDGTDWVSDGNGGWGSRYVLDQNSNMIHIKRWGMTDATTSILFDDAEIVLKDDFSNIISTISDNGGDGLTDYNMELTSLNDGDIEYDDDGRLIHEKIGASNNVTDYTTYHVPRILTRGATDVSLVRTALGDVVRADVDDGESLSMSTFVIPLGSVSDVAVYTKDGLVSEPQIHEWYIHGSGRLGVQRSGSNTVVSNVSYRDIGLRHYELSDHLGSVRGSVLDILMTADVVPTGDLKHAVDYDPYGGNRDGRTMNGPLGTSYRHGFQGMRYVEGARSLGEYRTTYRLYDVKTGRWSGQDPVFSGSRTSYLFNSANPISYVDPNGDTEFYYTNGNRIGGDNNVNGKTIILSSRNDRDKVKNLLAAGRTIDLTILTDGTYIELPPMHVRNLIKESIAESNAPNQSDNRGGYHEEGGLGLQVEGSSEVTYHKAISGERNSRVEQGVVVSVNPFRLRSRYDASPQELVFMYHSHPKAWEYTRDLRVASYGQNPSNTDIAIVRDLFAQNSSLRREFYSMVSSEVDNRMHFITKKTAQDNSYFSFPLNRFFDIPDAPQAGPQEFYGPPTPDNLNRVVPPPQAPGAQPSQGPELPGSAPVGGG